MGSGSSLLFLLLEPVLLNRGGTTLGAGLSLNLNGLGLVGTQVLCKVGLLGGWRGLGDGELLHLALGVGCLDLGGLEGLEFTEVEVLDEVGCRGVTFACQKRVPPKNPSNVNG